MSEYFADSKPLDAGSLITTDPRDPAFFHNPYDHYASWHKTRTVFYWETYSHWCLCGFRDVDRVLRDKRFGRQILHRYTREELGLAEPPSHLNDFTNLEAHSLLNLEPPEHARLRGHVNLQFAHRKVQSMRTEITTLADNILADLLASRPGSGANQGTAQQAKAELANTIDLLTEFAEPFAATVITRLLGITTDAIPDLLAWSHAMVKVYTCTQTHEEDILANRAAIEFREFLQHNIREKRVKPGDDLLSELVTEQTRNPDTALKDEEIISMIVLMLNAGHEATVHQLGNAVKALMAFQNDGHSTAAARNVDVCTSEKPGVADLLGEEKQAKRTVTELMRLDTPLHMFTRYALEPLSLQCDNGNTLVFKAGDQIGLLLGAANHDPKMFTSPEEFNPEREPLDSLSLGAGIHFCLGAALAQTEIEIALRALFCNDLVTKAVEGFDYEYADSYHFRGLKKLPVLIQTRP